MSNVAGRRMMRWMDGWKKIENVIRKKMHIHG
jgi:hypothetical protein